MPVLLGGTAVSMRWGPGESVSPTPLWEAPSELKLPHVRTIGVAPGVELPPPQARRRLSQQRDVRQ